MTVEQLKRDARKEYEIVTDIADSYTCGMHLAMQINPDLYRHAKKFNDLMDELAKVDPDAPKFRYELS